MPDLRISVAVLSYNHERFIAQALDGILGQTGEFSLEVIVADDCSTDGTLGILEEYERRFPRVVRLLPRLPHLGIPKNFERTLRNVRGEFIAVCDGDDYWTSADKLARQLSFLRERSDCALCFNAVIRKDEGSGSEEMLPVHARFLGANRTLTAAELVSNNFIGTGSCCMYRRRVVERLPASFFDLDVGDWIFNIACAQYGSIGFVNGPISVYRVHSGGIWSSKTPLEHLEWMLRCIEPYDRGLNLVFHREFMDLKRNLETVISQVRGRL